MECLPVKVLPSIPEWTYEISSSMVIGWSLSVCGIGSICIPVKGKK
jgi:hypothetical protein